MAIGRPRAEAARDTRREILDAALDLFAERGFHATSMRALAGAVGVRESALYHHFPSKEAILMAVAEERTRRVSSLLLPQLVAALGRPLPEILTLLCRLVLEQVSEPGYQKLLRILLADGGRVFAESGLSWRDFTEEPRKALTRALGQLKRDGKVRDDVEVEVFHLHLVAPLLVMSGVLFGGNLRPWGPLSMQRFIKQHVIYMARALAPARRPVRGRS